MTMNGITQALESLGRATVGALAGAGHAAMIFVESLQFAATGWRRGQPLRIAPVVEQMRQIGVDACRSRHCSRS